MSAIFSLLPGIGYVLPPESADPLDLPVLAVGVASANAVQASITTGAWTPTIGDFLAAFTLTRHSGTGGHTSLAPAGFTIAGGAMTQRVTIIAEGASVIRVSAWTGVVASSASGTLTLNTSGNMWQQAIIVMRVPGGSAFHRSASGQNLTGTTVTAAWASAPAAGALSIGCVGQIGTGGTGFALGGHSAVASAAGEVSSLKWGAFAKLGDAPSPLSFSGLQNNTAHAAVGIAIT